MGSECTRFYSKEDRKTGVKIANTRIIEIFNETVKRDKLSVFTGYMEFWRLGNFHDEWDVKDAKKIRDYLNDWIKRKEGEL